MQKITILQGCIILNFEFQYFKSLRFSLFFFDTQSESSSILVAVGPVGRGK